MAAPCVRQSAAVFWLMATLVIPQSDCTQMMSITFGLMIFLLAALALPLLAETVHTLESADKAYDKLESSLKRKYARKLGLVQVRAKIKGCHKGANRDDGRAMSRTLTDNCPQLAGKMFDIIQKMATEYRERIPPLRDFYCSLTPEQLEGQRKLRKRCRRMKRTYQAFELALTSNSIEEVVAAFSNR